MFSKKNDHGSVFSVLVLERQSYSGTSKKSVWESLIG